MPYEMPTIPPAPPAGAPNMPPPPAPPAANGPGMPPPPTFNPTALTNIPPIPAFPPLQLFASSFGLVWVVGNDYTRGWNGVMWISLT